jgi:hypothetical protein
MLTKPKRCPRLRAMLANETVEKPQIAQISIKKVLYLQQLFSQVQTFSTVSIGEPGRSPSPAPTPPSLRVRTRRFRAESEVRSRGRESRRG